MIKLQKKDGRSYSSIHSIRGVLRPAFQLAVDDDLIRKNPFSFQLVDAVVNDSVRREAISREEERKFLKFVKEDAHFSRYYEGIYILFKTGMRISEFCGLTVSDIDFKEHKINIDHQLQKKSKIGYYIEETKTESGTRVLPMTADVEECFKKLLQTESRLKLSLWLMVIQDSFILIKMEVLPMHFTGSITLNILLINTTVFIKCRCPK